MSTKFFVGSSIYFWKELNLKTETSVIENLNLNFYDSIGFIPVYDSLEKIRKYYPDNAISVIEIIDVQEKDNIVNIQNENNSTNDQDENNEINDDKLI